jgi:hypothetical protein
MQSAHSMALNFTLVHILIGHELQSRATKHSPIHGTRSILSSGVLGKNPGSFRRNSGILFEADYSCPMKSPKDPQTDVKDRGLCPWYFVKNVDDRRIPRTLLEARCKCQDCIDSGRTPTGRNRQCEPLYYGLRVMRRVEVGNQTKKYTVDWETIAVGCTCAFKRFASTTSRNDYV